MSDARCPWQRRVWHSGARVSCKTKCISGQVGYVISEAIKRNFHVWTISPGTAIMSERPSIFPWEGLNLDVLSPSSQQAWKVQVCTQLDTCWERYSCFFQAYTPAPTHNPHSFPCCELALVLSKTIQHVSHLFIWSPIKKEMSLCGMQNSTVDLFMTLKKLSRMAACLGWGGRGREGDVGGGGGTKKPKKIPPHRRPAALPLEALII